jgi:hypothetical protein
VPPKKESGPTVAESTPDVQQPRVEEKARQSVKSVQPPNPTNIIELIASAPSIVSMTEETTRYTKTLKEHLANSQFAKGIEIQQVTMAGAPGLFAFSTNAEVGTFVMFDDTPYSQTRSKIPIFANSQWMKQAAELAEQAGVVYSTPSQISKDDYPFVDALANHLIRNLGTASTSHRATTIGSFTDGFKNLFCSTNRDEVMTILRQHSPHATLGRVDWGFVLYVSEKPTTVFNRFIRNPQTGELDDCKPLLVIGGYTDIYHPMMAPQFNAMYGQQQAKGTKIITISEMWSAIASPGFLLGLGLPVMVDQIINNGVYANTFNLELGGRDFCSYFQAQDGSGPMKASSAMESINAMHMMCELAPQLAINIPAGRVRPFGIDHLLSSAGSKQAAAFENQLAYFFGGDGFQVSRLADATRFIWNSGTFRCDGDTVPLEELDYLRLIEKGIDPAEAAVMKIKQPNVNVYYDYVSKKVDPVSKGGPSYTVYQQLIANPCVMEMCNHWTKNGITIMVPQTTNNSQPVAVQFTPQNWMGANAYTGIRGGYNYGQGPNLPAGVI